MSLDYYNKVGTYMIQTWLKYWTGFTLTVYTEDTLPITDPRITIKDVNNLGSAFHKFQKATHTNSRATIFSKKAFPIIEHLKPSTGYLVWVDADVISEGYITPLWLHSLIGDDSSDNISAHFGVPQQGYYSVETGFFIINREHRYKPMFYAKYRSIYHRRDFSNMYKPFDGDSFGRVIRECREFVDDFSYRELSPKPDKILSPFNNQMQGKLWHLKAKHKDKDFTSSLRLHKALYRR